MSGIPEIDLDDATLIGPLERPDGAGLWFLVGLASGRLVAMKERGGWNPSLLKAPVRPDLKTAHTVCIPLPLVDRPRFWADEHGLKYDIPKREVEEVHRKTCRVVLAGEEGAYSLSFAPKTKCWVVWNTST